jgi:O-acetyl-ADP-ribose deacetylase
MTIWKLKHGEILDLKADGLICSANVQLNLSGGVGGAILLRYGDEMQRWLHDFLREKKLKYLRPGECVIAPPSGTPYKAVAHAVAIDGFYETSPDFVEQTYGAALRELAELGCHTVVAACLGCGYGRFPASEFVKVIASVSRKVHTGIDQVTLVTTNSEIVDALRPHLGQTP